MKHMKKFMALFAALALVFAMAVPAWADTPTTYTITINGGTGTYAAYQIFAGDLHEGTLSNIQWGVNVTEAGKTALGDAATKAKTITDAALARAFAAEVAPYLTDSPAGTGTTEITGLAAGYYLVKNTSVPQGEVYTDFIMEVVKNVTVQPKSGKPTLEKEIKHNESNTWGVVGDNQIGDTVEFRTITTVPNVSGYNQYTYTIKDEMSAGLTSNVQSVDNITIKVNDTTELPKSYYTVAVDSANANKFSVTINILNAIENGAMQTGDSLYTYYTGVLNENALIYNDGKQQNEAELEYSNNPQTDTTDHTPKKVVYDWTFKMEVSKVDGADNSKKLNGAKFVLSKTENYNLGTINNEGVPTNTNGLLKLIANTDGTYTVAPNGYTGTTVNVMTAGDITIKGLDDETEYYLYETKAPAGYNRLDNAVNFKIHATYNTDGSACNTVSTTVGTNTVNSLKIDVENNAGTTLPGTGGIGTTIFYVIGGGLMVAAAVLLIAKKRMENK